MPFIVIRPIYGTDADGYDFVKRWVDVGPAKSVADAKSRYSPVQYGYAVVMRRA